MTAARTSLRLVHGDSQIMRKDGSIGDGLTVAPINRTKRCVTCKEERAYPSFFQRGTATRRCGRCINTAKSGPGGLLGFRNPR